MNTFSIGMIAIGFLFIFVAAVGLLRMPDFYTRLHALGKSDTLGVTLVLGGLALHAESWWLTGKIALLLLIIFIANPTATHALARAAYHAGLRPWTREKGGGESR